MYGLYWPGKEEAKKEALTQTDLSFSSQFSLDDNVFITGDNLDALKLLQETHASKVKMIYIDPPYNTGKNKGYKDNFHIPKRTWMKDYPDTSLDGRFHTNWLNMMYPRLYLARNLLREDGVIFISIDDHEVVNLRKICDEVFGEENFIALFSWRRRTGANDPKKFYVSIDSEYVLAFAKTDKFLFSGIKKDLQNYSNPDDDSRGPWVRGDLTCNKTASERPNLFYSITDPKTGITYQCNPNNVWRFEKERMKRLIAEFKIIFPKNKTGMPAYKRHLSELRSLNKPVSSYIKSISDEISRDSDVVNLEFPLNLVATRELRDLLGGQYFDAPKSLKMISQLINQSTDTSDIILDFFSGSATTAHAVLDLNKQDGGNRKFILVQLPEPCAPESEAYKAGYKTIADIGEERIRRVIKKLEIDTEFKSIELV